MVKKNKRRVRRAQKPKRKVKRASNKPNMAKKRRVRRASKRAPKKKPNSKLSILKDARFVGTAAGFTYGFVREPINTAVKRIPVIGNWADEAALWTTHLAGASLTTGAPRKLFLGGMTVEAYNIGRNVAANGFGGLFGGNNNNNGASSQQSDTMDI